LRRIEEKEEEKIYERDWRTGHFSGGEIFEEGIMSRSQKVDLVFFNFLFNLFFIVSIFRTLGLGLKSDLSCCHICHI